MSKKSEPKITKYTGKPYTIISFIPDFKRFNMECLEDDIYSLFRKTYDCLDSKGDVLYLNDKL